MPYDLPADLRHEIEERMASGQYASEEDVLREAMRALKSRDEEIAAIQAGIDDMEGGRLRPFEEVDAEIRRDFGFSKDQ
jgi:putative addiction module CopG family antidote